MKNRIMYVVVSIIIGSQQLHAQDETNLHQAPSLQLGLNGLTFSKGDLDAQLIMEIIAEKQQELKVRLVENMFLESLQKTGGTVYNYATNVLKGVTQEPNSEARTRIILENTVNLVFVFSFAEYILGKDDVKINQLIKIHKGVYSSSIDGVSNFKRLQFNKPSDKIEFIALFLDMISEVIRNNTHLEKLGLMQVSYSPSYNSLNKYLKTNNNYCIKNPVDCGYRKSAHDFLKVELEKLVNVIGIADYIVNQMNISIKNSEKKGNPFKKESGLIETSERIDFSNLLLSISKTEIFIRDKWDVKSDSIFTIALNDLSNIRSLINKANRVLDISKLESDQNNLLRSTSDVVYLIHNIIIPTLAKYTKFNPEISNELDAIDKQTFQVVHSVLSDDNIYEITNNDRFTNILSLLYHFSESKTYIEFIGHISKFNNVFDDPVINSSLGVLNTYVTNNVSLHRSPDGQRYIDFNIESFLITLSRTNENKLRTFQFHFTVGANNIYFLSPLALNDGSSISNFSFISEKIGLKYKFYNPGAWKPRNIGDVYKNRFGKLTRKIGPPKEPFLSNTHILVFGSGILYNIASTGTSREFNFPIFGIGTGLTFYNSLDMNLTFGVPINNSLNFSQNISINRFYIGLGFDIQFTEYINRIVQNRKSNQTQKRLSH